MYHGDIRLGDTIDIKFTTVDTSGVPTTLAGTPVVSAYPGNSVTELTAGITLTVDFDARTGLHNVRVVATGGNGYATATDYALVITTGTVGGGSVVGYVVGTFSIEKRSAVMPTTAGRTLDVSATGEADANVTQWLGSAAATPTVAGVPEVDVTHWIGTAAATPTVAGVPEVDVTHFGGTAGAFASGRAEVNASHVAGTVQTAGDIIGDTNDIQARLPAGLVGGRMDASVGAMAAGVVTAAAVATGAIDADALAADAVTEIRSLASGTADSGTTTTMVDAARTEADTDYWKGCLILFTSGTLAGQVRLITAFDPVTDTITFAPATTLAVGTHTYEILPAGRSDVELWDGAAVNALVSGRVDASVGAMAANVLTATAIAADAITDAKVAADVTIASVTGAVGSVTGNVGGNVVGSVGSVAAGGITAASLAADTITAAKFAADVSAEIADAVWDEATAGHQTAGTTGKALTDAGSAGDPWSTALPGAYGAGTAGKIVGDNLNATVSSRATQVSVDAVDDFIDTEVAAIKAKTDQLTFTAANKVDATIQAAGDFAQAAADKVWSSATRTLTSLGAALVQEIWDRATSALITAGSIGKLIVDNLDAAISSRLASASYTAPPSATDNADTLLKRDMSAVTGEAARSPLNALRALRNKTSIVASTLTVTKEDDATTAWTAAVTTSPAADPVVGVDPS